MTEPQPHEEPVAQPDVIVVPPGQWGWAHFQHPDPGVLGVHLMPTFDCGDHAFDGNCACRPVEDQPGWWVHHAHDGREAYQFGARRKH